MFLIKDTIFIIMPEKEMKAISTNWAPSMSEASCLYSLSHPFVLPCEEMTSTWQMRRQSQRS